MKYIKKTFVIGHNTYASSITGTKDFSFEIYRGDTFTVRRKFDKEDNMFVAVYNGSRNGDRIGTEFCISKEFLDDFCILTKAKNKEPPCHCTTEDISGIGHLPTCEFKLAGGCGGNPIFKVR